MSKKWVSILDPDILKVGMRVKCCLDCFDPIYTDRDEEDEFTGNLDWFTGVISRVEEEEEDDGRTSLAVVIWRDPNDDNDSSFSWHTNIDSSTIQYIKIEMLMEWDD